jgi:hypothetical protein
MTWVVMSLLFSMHAIGLNRLHIRLHVLPVLAGNMKRPTVFRQHRPSKAKRIQSVKLDREIHCSTQQSVLICNVTETYQLHRKLTSKTLRKERVEYALFLVDLEIYVTRLV